jgi:predicted nucleic acid-binding protein
MLLYLDTCCLNRPFDDQTQVRVSLESQAVMAILAQVEHGRYRLANGSVLTFEVGRIRDDVRRQGIEHFLAYSADWQPLTTEVERRGSELIQSGFRRMDALHLASAESIQADCFLSTDDRLIARAQNGPITLQMPVINPLFFNHPTP